MKPAKQLAVAVAEGNLDLMRGLLSNDPGLSKDWQPIMDGCYMGQVEAVELLLDAGADPNVLSRSAFKYRPLHRTIERKVTFPRTERHVQVVRLLLDRGAGPTLRATQGQVNAVAMAALSGERRFLDLLLPRVAEHDLFLAAVVGDVAKVRDFLKSDPELAKQRDVNGWSALDYASRSRMGEESPAAGEAQREIITSLVQAGADASGALDSIVYRNDVALTALLLRHGAKIQDGDTLNHAACEGRHEALALVVEAGTDLNLTAGTGHHGGYTPFGCTLTMRSLRGAQWFLDQGVDPNYVGGPSGENSMHVAVRNGAGSPLLKLLVDRGADPALRDGSGVTPMDAAREKGNRAAVEFLTGLGA